MSDKKFFGIMGNASKFLKELTLLETSKYGWIEKYLDERTGNHWLKYMVDRDNGRYYNLMLLTPRPTTDEMIEICFTALDHDEVEGAAHRLLFEEEEEKIEFRQKVIDRLKTIDILHLDSEEKRRLKTIILNGHLTGKINQWEVVGKHISEIQNDVDFYRKIAEDAEQILKQL
jgi:hypothetical protein